LFRQKLTFKPNGQALNLRGTIVLVIEFSSMESFLILTNKCSVYLGKMKKLYLILSVTGFIAPSILVAMESIETGNILLYAHPMTTIEAMFVNRVTSIFLIDLLFTLMVFFVWTYIDRREIGIKKITLVWILTMLFGLAGGFPLYLYLKEKTK
jgi:hypothetical protein